MILSFRTFILTAAASLIASSLHAQQAMIPLQMGDVKVSGITFDTQKTPIFQADGVKSKNIPNQRDWLEIEVPFEIKGPRNGVIKELTFRYYVGLKDQTGAPRVLTGDVKHINMLCGDKTFSCAYVAPAVLGEITGDFRRFQANAVQGVGVEIYYNGVIVGGSTSTNTKFWETLPTTPGVLGKAETPFALLWIDRYAEVDRAAR